MKNNLDLIIKKNNEGYSTHLDIDTTMALIKEYYRKCKKRTVKVYPLSCMEGCGINEKTGKPIIKGLSAFSAYSVQTNGITGKTIVKDEWIEESTLKGMMQELFRAYNYEINEIIFYADIYLKNNNAPGSEEIIISEEAACEYDSRELYSKPRGMSVSFSKKKNFLKEAVLSLKKKNSPNTASQIQ